jgi:hypothetical protein
VCKNPKEPISQFTEIKQGFTNNLINKIRDVPFLKNIIQNKNVVEGLCKKKTGVQVNYFFALKR